MVASSDSGRAMALCPSAIETARAVRAGEQTATAATQAALDRIGAREADLLAFEYLDPKAALNTAAALDTARSEQPLAGVPIAIKDIIDTADMPTRNGCAHEFDRRPSADATVVRRLKQAGAIVVGKTTTTECAYYSPTKTRNPHDPARTPGGSSSGSAAAIGAGLVPLALGTQTSGSIIRPASFCGVWGMKPSFGLVPRTGVLMLCQSLDHVGALAGRIEDLARAIDLISGADDHDPASVGARPSRLEYALGLPLDRPRLAFARSFAWPEMEPSAAQRFDTLAKKLGAVELDMGAPFDDALLLHRTIMAHEMAHNLWPKYLAGGERLSKQLREFLIEGRGISAERYFDALKGIARLKTITERLFRPFDGIITPSAPGEAPLGLSFTGSRAFCLLWSTLGVPAVNVPGLKGEAGLPLGVQVVGARGSDAQTLRAAAWLGQALASAAP